MKVIVGLAGSGKTYQLLKWVKENPEKRVLVVPNAVLQREATNTLIEWGIPVGRWECPNVMTFQNIRDRLHVGLEKEFAIDEVGLFLQQLFGMRHVKILSVTGEIPTDMLRIYDATTRKVTLRSIESEGEVNGILLGETDEYLWLQRDDYSGLPSVQQLFGMRHVKILSVTGEITTDAMRIYATTRSVTLRSTESEGEVSGILLGETDEYLWLQRDDYSGLPSVWLKSHWTLVDYDYVNLPYNPLI